MSRRRRRGFPGIPARPSWAISKPLRIGDAAAAPFRFPVQWVSRPNLDFRGFAGTVAAGSIAVGDQILAMGSDRPTRVEQIVTFDGNLDRAGPGDAVTLTVTDEIDVSRGDLLVDPSARSDYADQFAAHVIWFQDEHLVPGRSHWLKLGARTVLASVTTLKHRIDVDTGAQIAARTLELNEIGVCNLLLDAPIAFDPYATQSHRTGAFILIDRYTNETAGRPG